MRFRCLLVEDDDDCRQALMGRITNADSRITWQFVESASLGEALEACTDPEGMPDLVVLDLSLPDSKGLDTIRSMVHAVRSVPVVVVSGYLTPELTMECGEQGALACVSKDDADDQLAISLLCAIGNGNRRFKRSLAISKVAEETLRKLTAE